MIVAVAALLVGGIIGGALMREWNAHVTGCLLYGLVKIGLLDEAVMGDDAVATRALEVGWISPLEAWKESRGR